MANFTYPVTTNNLNIRSLYESYQQMLTEIDNSLSKGTIGTGRADAGRWLSYIASIQSYLDYYQSLSPIDWPVTKGRDYELKDPLYPDYEFKENTGVQDLIDMVVNARDELVTSASSELPMILYPADIERQNKYLESMRAFINGFLLAVQPLDQPITSAQEQLDLSD